MSELAAAIREAIEARLRDVHVCLPGRIASYSLADKTADVDLVVRPTVPRADGDGITHEDLPQLRNIPVCQPAAGGFFVHLPVKVGDFVWVHCSDVSIDKYRDVGDLVDALDPRVHHLAHAWAVPMYDPAAAPSAGHASNLVIGEAGGAEIHIEPGGTINLGSENPSDRVALESLVEAELQDLSDRIAVFERVFTLWTPVALDGGAALKTAYGADPGTPGAAPGNVGSTVVESD